MKKLVVAGCAALALCAANAESATAGFNLTFDCVQQRYPWNGLVDIDYTITCEPGVKLGPDENIEVLFIDKAVTNRAISFLQAPLPMTAGKHRITWDAHADGVTRFAESATFQMDVVHYNDVYMVIDVSGGPSASVYPVKFLNTAPVGGFNKDEYKGSNIVLRCIHPGSYMAGSPADEKNRKETDDREKQHRVALSKPFYIGIFEVTQKQYKNVMGEDPSTHKGDLYPVEMVAWNTIRGGTWPNGNPASSSFMNKLCSKCKSQDANGNYVIDVKGFDLPTDFQWEYACRAGTTGAFNTTNEYANTSEGQKWALGSLGRYKENGGEKGYHAVVGSYQPNQWGLYDMHGNVWEWCLDWYVADLMTLDPKQYTDPIGASSGERRVRRGGSWSSTFDVCRSAYRDSTEPSTSGTVVSEHATRGFRLCRTVP